MTSRAFIAGCLGTSLTADERAFFRDARPWGFIVFKRNTQTPEQVARMPANMDFAGAAVFLQANATAYFALVNRGALRAGETLLVLGAAGGTGAAAVQLGKALGASAAFVQRQQRAAQAGIVVEEGMAPRPPSAPAVE